MPAGVWLLVARIVRKFSIVDDAYKKGKETFWKALNKKQQTSIVLFFVTFFFFMELLWRMMFEFLIAYMQMRDALLQLQI